MVVPPWYNVVLVQMLEALQFLHSKNVMVVHRDITPENILYDQPDHFILAGFSLARIVFPKRGEYLERRNFRYLAPEVYAGLEETTGVDIWALGLLCLDMLHLLPDINVSHRPMSFALFREHNWCDHVTGFVDYADRPELKMMVVKRTAERYSAGEVLRFVRTSPSSKILRYPASAELLYFMVKIHSGLKDRSEAELREFIDEFMRANPSSLSAEGQIPMPPEDIASSSSSSTARHLPTGAAQPRTESTQPGAAGAREMAAPSTSTSDPKHEPRGCQREQPIQAGSKALATTSSHLSEVPEQPLLRGPRSQDQRGDAEPNPQARQHQAQSQKSEAEAMKASVVRSSDTADAPGQPSQPSAPLPKGAESSPSRSRRTWGREERGKGGRAGQASPPQDQGASPSPSSSSSRGDKAQLEQGGAEAHLPPPPLPTSRRQRQDPSSSGHHREEIRRDEQGKAARTKELSPPSASQPVTGQSSQGEATAPSRTEPPRTTAPQTERDQPPPQHHAGPTTRQEASGSKQSKPSSRGQHTAQPPSRGQRRRRQ